MQRIRGYYRTLVPEAGQFFGPDAEDERYSAAMATVGLRTRPAGIAAALALFGLHLLDQQQRAATLVLRPPAEEAWG
jgi:hypothetical protein